VKEQDLGRGQRIIGFDTQEELFNYLASQRQASIEALAHTLPEQNAIGWGSHVFKVAPPDLAIFGYILTEAELEDPEELAMTRDARTRGMVYGQWFSEVVPEGEYGSTHIIECWPITTWEFRLAGEKGWQPWPELLDRVRDEIDAARLAGE